MDGFFGGVRVRARWVGCLFGAVALVGGQLGAQNNVTVTVRHAPALNGPGRIEGSLQQLLGENVTLNGGFTLVGDLLVPGTPMLQINGNPVFAGAIVGAGSASPTGHKVTLNGNVSLGYLRTRTAPVALPIVPPPPAPVGARSVTISAAGQSIGNPATLRNLTLNGNVGQVVVPPGTYGNFVANGGSGFTLGVAGATTPSIYNFQNLTLNGGTRVEVVGPTILTVANGFTGNGLLGTTNQSSWLQLQLACGGFTLNGGCTVHGSVVAPAGTVIINGNSCLIGSVKSDRLTINGNGCIKGSTITANQPPVANAQSVTTAEDTARNITLTGSDPEGAMLIYTVLTQPTRGSLIGIAPNFTYTTGANENGTDSFTFKVNDGTQDSVAATVTITITPVNDAPVAQGQSISTAEDTVALITLVGTDVEGSPLTYTVVTQPQHGILLNPVPDLLYMPDPNYSGSDSFTFRVNDGLLNSAAATLSIAVSPLNDRPVAEAQALSVNEDTVLPVALTGTDVENDPLIYTVLTQPGHGTLSGTTPNLTYRPVTNYNGADSFAFRVSDGSTNSTPATISLVVLAVNDRPIAYPTNYATLEDTATNVVISASDIEDSNLTYIVVTQPAHGSLTGTGTNLIYSPDADYHGPDSFRFKASDGLLDSDVVTVGLAVSPANDAPIADANVVTAGEDVSASITLTGSDVDGDALIFTIATQPSHGSLSGTPPDLVYAPATDYHGPDGFSYLASDGTTNSAPASVSLIVQPVNDAPVADEQLIVTDEDAPLPVTLLGSDADGDALSFVVVDPPLFGVLSGASLNLVYTPDANFTGTDSFIYFAEDGQTASGLATVTVEVMPQNDLATATSQSLITLEDTSVPIHLTGADIDGDALLFLVTTPPSHGVLVGGAPDLIYTPAPNYHGPDSFTFVVSDGLETSLHALAAIDVTPVNDPPLVVGGSFETGQDIPVAVHVAGTDVEGDKLSFRVVLAPGHGTLGGTGPDYIYTPAPGFHGSDSFAVVANDGDADSPAASVTVVVSQAENGPFTVEAGPDRILAAASATLAGTATIPSPVSGENTNILWTKLSGPGAVQFASGTALITEAAFAEPGTYTLKLLVGYNGGERSDRLMVVVLPPVPERLTAARSSRGSDFWLTFLDNGHPFGESGHSGLSFAVAAETDTTGLVSFLGQGEWHTNYFEVRAGITTVVPIADFWTDPTLAYSDAIQDNAIHITTKNEVSVQALNYLDFSTDGYLALPASLLGTEYVVLGYKNSPDTQNPAEPVGGTQFAIVATEDNTQVAITSTLTTGSRVAGVPYQITLHQGQTYRLMNLDSLTGDLSGTTISADKPVAVFGGHQCANVPAGVPACDHLVEQLPPVNLWGRQFVTMPLAGRSGGDTFRILAMTDGTLVAVNGDVVARLNRGQFHERTNAGPTQISASEPVLVAQYANGQVFDGSVGDPFMMLVPPAEQFGGSYILATPRLFDYWAYEYVDIFANYLNLTVRTNGTGTIQLDGAPVSAGLFQPIGNSGYAGAQVPVSPGTHRLKASVPFGVSLYGWANFESYANIGGIYSESVEADTRLVLRQSSDRALVGTEKVVIASLTNGRQRPLADVEVTFNVTGANNVTRRVRTNPFGEAEFAYAGTSAGEDLVEAVVVGLQRTVANIWLQSSDNLPPVIDPGANQFVALNQITHLAATASDDGKPAGATLTYQWRTASGYVPARFAQPNQPVTDVTFDLPGVYQLELSVSDSMFSVRSSVTITVNDVPRVLSLWSYPSEQPYSVGQTVTLLAEVSDSDGRVSLVEFFDGGLKIGESSPPESSSLVSIDWTFSQPGDHPLTVLVTDDLGGVTRSMPFSIRVVSPPLVEWISPATGHETIAGVPFPLTISATDLDGTVTNVVFVVDYYTPDYVRAEFAVTGAGPNYTGSWTPPRAGDYYFYAYAWDNDGAAGAAGIYVRVVEQPPTLEIVSPTDGSLLDVSNAVPVFVSLDDPSLLVTNLEFLVDGVKIGDSTISFLSWTPTNLGAHTIQVVSVDRRGGRTPSTLVNVTISDLLPPVVAVVSPTNDAQLAVGTAVSLEAVASDSDGVVTNLVLQLDGLEIIQTNAAGLQLAWTNTSAGWHTLLALATDDHGQTIVAEPIRFFVERTEDAGLPAPEGLVAEAISDRENKLTWLSAPTNVVVAGVIIEQQSPVDGSWSELTLASTEITSHNDPDLEPETRYGYRAAFVGGNGQRSAYSTVALQTTRTTLPGYAIIDITDSVAAAQAGQSQGGAGGFTAFAAASASAPAAASLAPLDLGSLEPLWMADDGTCLLFAGPGHYAVWKFGAPPVSLVNSNFIAHRLTRHGVVVGNLQLPDGTDSFGHQLPRSRGVMWIPGQPAPVEVTPDDYAYRFPKDAAITPDVGLTYQLTGTPSGLPELIGLVQDFPTLHDVWDLNAAGQAVGNATVYLRPFDFNNDGVFDSHEIELSPSERHQYTTNGDLNWLIITERGVTAGYSGDAFHEVHYNALLASAARFDTNGWRWLGPLATNDANGSASALSIALLANDAGMIAGYAAARTGNPQVDALFPSHAFRYTPASPEFALGVSVLTDLGVLSGGLDSFPRAINQYGEIVGHADFDTLQLGGGPRDPRMLHAVYWSASATSPNDLGTLGPVPSLGFPQGHSDAYAINDLTQIVGTSFRPTDGASTAVFWQINRNRGSGASAAPYWEINDFNNSIPQSIWHLSKAVGVNNDRFVLAKGQRPVFGPDGTFITWSPRSVLLPPVSVQSRDRFFTGSIEMPEGSEPGDFIVTFSLRTEDDTFTVIEGPIRAQERIYATREAARKSSADKILTAFGGAPRFQDKVILYRDPSRPRQILFSGYSPKFGTLEIDVRVQGRIWPTIPHVLDEDAEFAEFAVHFDQLCRGRQSQGSLEFPTVFLGPLDPIFSGIVEFTGYQRGEAYPTQDLSEQLYAHALSALLLESFIKDEIKLPLVYVRGVISGLTDGIIFDATAIRDVAVVGSAVVIAAQFGPAYLAYLAAFHPEAIAARVEALETVIEGLKKIKLADVPVIARNIGRGIYRQWTTKVQSDTGWFYDGQPVGSNPEIMRKYTEGYVTGFVLEQAGVTLATAGISKYAALPKLAREFVRLLEIARAGVEGIALQGANQVRKAVVATYLVHAASAPAEGWLRNMSRAAFRAERHIPGGRFSAEEMNRIFNSLREKGVYEADRVVLEMTRTRWFKPGINPQSLELFQARYLQSLAVLERELPSGRWIGTEGLVQVIDSVVPPGQADRVGDLFHALNAETAAGRQMAVDTLAGASGKTSDTIISQGLKVSEKIKDVYPTMYHYADADTLLAHAVENANGVGGSWRLNRKTGGRYIGTEDLASHAAAKDRYQLPHKIRNGVVDPTTGRFKCVVQTADVADNCVIPRAFDHSTGTTAVAKEWIEPVVRDNPLRGNGGAVQFTQEREVVVTVVDLKTGQTVRDQAHLQQLLTDFP